MSIELDLLSLFGDYESYTKYNGHADKLVKSGFLSPITAQVYSVLDEYYTKYGDTKPLDWSSLTAWAMLMSKAKLSKSQADLFRTVCDNVAAHAASVGSGDEVVMRLKTMDFGERAIPLLEDMATTGNPDALTDLKAMLDSTVASVSSTATESFVTGNIEDILKSHVSGGGLDWRFDEMNVMAGPIRYGDLVIVFGRPEIGKTSFVISEIMHWCTQMAADDKVIIFNNEEGGSKLVLRAYTAALNVDGNGLAVLPNPRDKFVAACGGDKLLVYDNSALSIRDVERVCESVKPKVIVFNVLDKVMGFDKLSEVERLRKVAVWARDLGKKYNAVVVCVGQADATAEAEKYLYMNQYYGSKTGVPGEADLMVGIGCDPNEPDLRFFHLCKNKLSGGPRSDPARSHGFAAAKFDKGTGRYVNHSSVS